MVSLHSQKVFVKEVRATIPNFPKVELEWVSRPVWEAM